MFLAQVFDFLAFDEPDAAVSLSEGVAVLAYPGCGDQDACCGVLVVHDPGEGAYRLDSHRAAVAFRLDDAVPAHEGIFIDGTCFIQLLRCRRILRPTASTLRLAALDRAALTPHD